MSEIDSWLQRYEETHENLRNPVVYWAAVPMIVVGTVGILWDLPVPPEFLEISPLLNWGSAFLMSTAIYYFIISLSLAIGMLPFLLGLASMHQWLATSVWPHSGVSIALLVAGTIGLILGRWGKGSLRGVVEDFQLMMIGPVWLLSVIYRRLQIPF
ncbi:MAG: hypothetical protein QNJ14_14275 [Woeseiaceae bacterium]|nr:hypothetical protein [Woeseiaceae bacterium]